MSDIQRVSDAETPAEAGPDAPRWFEVREPALIAIKAVLSVLILAWLAIIVVLACRVGWSPRLVSHIKSVKILRLVKEVVGDFGSKGAGKGRRLWKALLKHGHA